MWQLCRKVFVDCPGFTSLRMCLCVTTLKATYCGKSDFVCCSSLQDSLYVDVLKSACMCCLIISQSSVRWWWAIKVNESKMSRCKTNRWNKTGSLIEVNLAPAHQNSRESLSEVWKWIRQASWRWELQKALPNLRKPYFSVGLHILGWAKPPLSRLYLYSQGGDVDIKAHEVQKLSTVP